MRTKQWLIGLALLLCVGNAAVAADKFQGTIQPSWDPAYAYSMTPICGNGCVVCLAIGCPVIVPGYYLTGDSALIGSYLGQTVTVTGTFDCRGIDNYVYQEIQVLSISYDSPAPAPAANPSPGDGAGCVPASSILSWTKDEGFVYQKIYFGTDPDPPLVNGFTTSSSYNPGPLLPDTAYYWRVDSTNFCGSTPGSTWTFTTSCPASPQTWSRTYGGVDRDEAWSIQQTTDGGYVVAGYTQSFGAGSDDFWVLKLDAVGNVQWQKTYGGGWGDYARSIQQTTDGGFVVAGWTESFGAGSWDYWVLKLDAVGNVQWQKTFGGASLDEAFSIQQTTDGGFVVARRAYSFGAGAGDFWVLKLDASGNVEWQKTYGGTSDEYADSIQQTTDGGFIVAGYTQSFGAGWYDFWVLKLDASGNVQWQKTYGGGGADFAYSIQQTSDGDYVVAGFTNSFGAGGADAWVLKLDASGNVQWQKTYGDFNSDYARSIQQTSDSGFVVAGYMRSFGAGGWDVWVLKLDASGNVQWQKTYGGASNDLAVSIQQATDGGFVVAGQTESFGADINGDFWVLKLDANGNIDASCTFIADTSVTGVNSGAVPANTAATVTNSSASITNTAVTGVNSSAVVAEQCLDTFPYLAYSSSIVSDCGNDDGVIDQREKIELSVALESLGGADAYNVGGVLSTPTKGIAMVSDTASFSDIPSGFTGTSLAPFVFYVSASVPCGTVIDFTLDLIYEDVSGDLFSDSASFQLQVGTGGTSVCNPNCGCAPVSALGDTDANGCTDGLDLMRLARAFGSGCGEGDFLNDADLDNSDLVDGDDLDALIEHFGNGCGAP